MHVKKNLKMLPLIYSLLFLPLAFSLPDGLHRTPPMGWTSWNTYFEENSQEKMISQIDALLELNLHQFGYNILTIDDYWQLPERDNITGSHKTDFFRRYSNKFLEKNLI